LIRTGPASQALLFPGKPWIASRWWDFARHPSDTTGRAVFRIRPLKAAAFPGRQL